MKGGFNVDERAERVAAPIRGRWEVAVVIRWPNVARTRIKPSENRGSLVTCHAECLGKHDAVQRRRQHELTRQDLLEHPRRVLRMG